MPAAARKRLHRVNAALIAHSVPLCYCERIPFLVIACLALIPIAATGVTHWQPDLFGIVAFFPLWGAARLLYLYDPRSAAKVVEHLSWTAERYVPRLPHGAARRRVAKPGRARSFARRLRGLLTRAMRS
jgi:hypothetical protein